jgi:hypothetical protein
MTDEKKQRGGWFRRKGRENALTPSTPQPANSGKLAQWLTAWQERMDNANRRRDLATRLNQDLAGILATCAEQEKALGQRYMRTQVQLSMSLGRLSGFVRQLESTRAVCAYLLEATQPQLPAVPSSAGAGVNGANGVVSSHPAMMIATPASASRPLNVGGSQSGPLAAPVVRDLGRGGFKRMARDLQQAYRETAQATQGILHPVQTQGIHIPEASALANALSALEPLMTWLNQRCEALTATYCAPAGSQQPGTPPGRRGDFWQ